MNRPINVECDTIYYLSAKENGYIALTLYSAGSYIKNIMHLTACFSEIVLRKFSCIHIIYKYFLRLMKNIWTTWLNYLKVPILVSFQNIFYFFNKYYNFCIFD